MAKVPPFARDRINDAGSTRLGVVKGLVRWWLLIGFVTAALACSKSESVGHGSAGKTSASALAPGSPATSAEPASSATPHPQTPHQMVAEWTRALNAADVSGLGRLYADKVRFYGTWLTRDQVLERKRQALAADRSFRQLVLGNPTVSPEGETMRVAFHKRSGPKAALRDVFATLVLSQGPPLLIQEESDAVTEKRFAPKAQPPPAVDCGGAVWDLVGSTPEAQRLFRDIDKNLKEFPPEADLRPGGLGPMTPAENGDDTYSLAIGVHHPERFEAYAWFTIDLTGKVTASGLAIDAQDATLRPLRQALAQFKRLCPIPPPKTP
jgi:hypothetical protein